MSWNPHIVSTSLAGLFLHLTWCSLHSAATVLCFFAFWSPPAHCSGCWSVLHICINILQSPVSTVCIECLLVLLASSSLSHVCCPFYAGAQFETPSMPWAWFLSSTSSWTTCEWLDALLLEDASAVHLGCHLDQVLSHVSGVSSCPEICNGHVHAPEVRCSH